MSDQDVINAALEKLHQSTVALTPRGGLLHLQNLTNLDNWRAFIHQITPVVVSVLVGIHAIDNDKALLWVPLFFAIIDPLLSYINTEDKIRKIVYGVVGLMQSGALVASLFGVFSEQLPIIGGAFAVFNAVLARFYTPTSNFKVLFAIPKAEGSAT